MKKTFFGILLLAVTCSSAFAQNTPCANMPAGPQAPGRQQGQAEGMMMQAPPRAAAPPAGAPQQAVPGHVH